MARQCSVVVIRHQGEVESSALVESSASVEQGL